MPLPPKLRITRLRTTQPAAPRVRPLTPAPAELPLRMMAPIVGGWIVVAWVSVGNALRGEMVPAAVKLMVCGPAAPLALVMAVRREPLPLSLVLLTVNVIAPAATP